MKLEDFKPRDLEDYLQLAVIITLAILIVLIGNHIGWKFTLEFDSFFL